MNPYQKARKNLIRLAAKRAITEDIRIADRREMWALLNDIATQDGGALLAVWQRSNEAPGFGTLSAAVLKEYEHLQAQDRESDRASAEETGIAQYDNQGFEIGRRPPSDPNEV